MNKIPSKIYFLSSSGEVLAITGEMEWSESITTKEQDMNMYQQLQDKSIDEIDYIELEYGTLSSTFTNVKSYSVDVGTKTLNCVYYTQEELGIINLENQQRLEEEQLINDRISIISNYATLDNNSIESLENSIIEYETNLITGGI